MKQVRNIVCIGLLMSIIVSCNEKEKTVNLDSGLSYTYINQGEGEQVKKGEFLLLNIQYKDQNDSVWMNTEDQGYGMIIPKKDSIWNSEVGNVNEIFYNLVKGDSIVFNINIKELFIKTFHAQVPDGVNDNMLMTFNVGVQDVMNESEVQAHRQKQQAKLQKKMMAKGQEQDSLEQIEIKKYLEDNNIDAKRTENDLYYYVIKQGDGKKPENGDRIKVNYSGKILNGDYFDSSVKSVAQENNIYNAAREPYSPFEFNLGRGEVIKGWDEGFSLLNVGDQAVLIIPSKLGYGARPMGNKIPAYSILMFEIELLEVVN